MTSITAPRKVLTWPKSRNEPAILITSKLQFRIYERDKWEILEAEMWAGISQIKND